MECREGRCILLLVVGVHHQHPWPKERKKVPGGGVTTWVVWLKISSPTLWVYTLSPTPTSESLLWLWLWRLQDWNLQRIMRRVKRSKGIRMSTTKSPCSSCPSGSGSGGHAGTSELHRVAPHRQTTLSTSDLHLGAPSPARPDTELWEGQQPTCTVSTPVTCSMLCNIDLHPPDGRWSGDEGAGGSLLSHPEVSHQHNKARPCCCRTSGSDFSDDHYQENLLLLFYWTKLI